MCDFESPSFYQEDEVKARKTHPCYECPFDINPGETYVVCKGVWDGEFSSYKLHQACRETALAQDRECPAPFGDLLEYLLNGLDKPHKARGIWAQHLWKNRHHPRADHMLVSSSARKHFQPRWQAEYLARKAAKQNDLKPV